MEFTRMSFDKNWNNYADFPTHESQEAKVRADMQYLYDSIKDQFNYFLEYELLAGNIPYTSNAGVQADNVQDAIDAVHAEILDIVDISVADGSITDAKLKQVTGEEAVITAAIRDGAVTTAKVHDGAILTAKIGNGAVSDEKLGDGSVYERHITTGAVTATKLASNSVITAKIKNGNVTVDKLATNSVSTVKIVDGAVTTAKIANSAVTYAKTSGVQQQHSTTTATLSSGHDSWTVNVTGVTATNTVICTPAPASFAQWVDNRVRCSAQADGSLTFIADTSTSEAITVNVLILN